MKLTITALSLSGILWSQLRSASIESNVSPSKYDPESTGLSRGRLVTTLLIHEIKRCEISLFGGSDGGVSVLGFLIHGTIRT